MKAFIKENRLLLILILITVIAATVTIAARINVERENKTYDVVLDYNEIAAMAEQSDHDVSWWLSQFKEMGINKVGLTEESIITLMEDTELDVTGEVMYNITCKAGWREDYPAEFLNAIEEKGYDRFDVLVEARGKEATEFITKGIESRIDADRYIMMKSDAEPAVYCLIDGTADVTLYSELYKYMNSKKGGFAERADIESSKIMYMSLGLLPEKVKLVQDAGMNIEPRTLSYNGWNDTNYAKAVIAGYEKYGIKPDYLIVGGEAVIGYDDGIDFAKDYIIGSGIPIGMIENTTQLQNILQYGVTDVTTSSDYNAVRVFSVWDYIQYRYQYYGYEGAEEIENTLFRAVTERNVRVIYFKPFKELKDTRTYITNADEYAQMFSNLEARLEKQGFSFGQASVMRHIEPSTLLRVLVGIGAALGAVLLIRAAVPINKKLTYILCGLGALAVIAAYFVMPNTSILITAFAAAVVFGCLSVTFVTAQTRFLAEQGGDAGLCKIIGYGIITLAVAVGISLIGGMMTAGPLSATSFMLEIDIFRGVKISQLLPIAWFAVAYLAFYGYGARKKHIGRLELHDIRDLMGLQIKVWMLLGLAVVGAVGYYYIARTGHDSSIEVSSMEMLFRNKLEELLVARPRTKEFLFAFPAIMMMVYCSVKKLRIFTIVFGVCGTVGLTSVINTFMHIRTPLYLGFARTGYSLVFGMIIGIVGMVIFDLLYRLYRKYLKEKVDRALA